MSAWRERVKAEAPRLIWCATDGAWLAVTPESEPLSCGAWGKTKVEARRAYAAALFRMRGLVLASPDTKENTGIEK